MEGTARWRFRLVVEGLLVGTACGASSRRIELVSYLEEEQKGQKKRERRGLKEGRFRASARKD